MAEMTNVGIGNNGHRLDVHPMSGIKKRVAVDR